MLTVCTARLSYGGPGRLDITRAHATKEWEAGRLAPGAIFAPDSEALASVLSGRLTVPRYFEIYRWKLERISQPNLSAWIDGAHGNRLVGVCYCSDLAKCHRTVWRAFMVAHGALDGGELSIQEQRRRKKPSTQGTLF